MLRENPFSSLETTGISELQAAMSSGRLCSRQLCEQYLTRISALDRDGPMLQAIIEVNPDALEIAEALDQERIVHGPRGPLHGIPVLLKENIATRDQMSTTAGSLALLGARVPHEASVVGKLREAGAVILGKTNLSEWANSRSIHASGGWSARGGQTRNPYVLDRSPGGSSSGSATAMAAGLATVALGTETDGSILCPAAVNAVVGIKPTVGLTNCAGVIPVSHSQDTVGPIGRTVTDCTLLLEAIVGLDERNGIMATGKGRNVREYTQFLDPAGLQGARVGVARQVYFGYNRKTDAVIEEALIRLRELGAEVIDPADIPTAQQIHSSDAENVVLLADFKADLNAYLAALETSPVRTLEDVIAFNEAHATEEMAYFGQELFFEALEAVDQDSPEYRKAREECLRLSRREGIDAVMEKYRLDALAMPTTSPAWVIDLYNGDHYTGGCSQPAALAGYPAISVPAGYVSELPVGITFMGRAYSEPTLIKLAYAYEQGTQHRHPPGYLPTLGI